MCCFLFNSLGSGHLSFSPYIFLCIFTTALLALNYLSFFFFPPENVFIFSLLLKDIVFTSYRLINWQFSELWKNISLYCLLHGSDKISTIISFFFIIRNVPFFLWLFLNFWGKINFQQFMMCLGVGVFVSFLPPLEFTEIS
jgi:hypothetical protein